MLVPDIRRVVLLSHKRRSHQLLIGYYPVTMQTANLTKHVILNIFVQTTDRLFTMW